MAAPAAPLVAVVGPTASGKSALALRLARERSGEIVSCDSLQVYRGLDIGTAKPTPEERAQVRHHLVDVADPDEPFSAATWRTNRTRLRVPSGVAWPQVSDRQMACAPSSMAAW